MNPNADVYQALEQFPELNLTFSSWEISEIRQSWASMRDDQIEVSQEKANVGTASAFFCQQFYENLLGEYPELSVLFPSIKSQASSMAGILSLVIAQLDNLRNVRDVIIALGKRHSRIIGVEVTHYELVGNALLRTLSDRLQDKFTPELENAWIKFFTYLTNLMLQAGEDPPLPAQTLYPVLTPTDSNASSISATARRALKPRPSNTSSSKAPVPASNANSGFHANTTSATNTSSLITGAAVSGNNNTFAGSSNSTAAQTSYNTAAINTPNATNYSPSTSHFKVQGQAPKAAKRRRGNGKGQECTIM